MALHSFFVMRLSRGLSIQHQPYFKTRFVFEPFFLTKTLPLKLFIRSSIVLGVAASLDLLSSTQVNLLFCGCDGISDG